VNASQFDSALESRGQGLNDASAKNGFGTGNHKPHTQRHENQKK